MRSELVEARGPGQVRITAMGLDPEQAHGRAWSDNSRAFERRAASNPRQPESQSASLGGAGHPLLLAGSGSTWFRDNLPMPLKAALDDAAHLSDWLQHALHEQATLEHGRRSAIALAFASLALDHREAFLLLVVQGARATAMAVTRPVLEAYVRSLWSFELASDQQLEEFMLQGRHDPSMESTLQALRRKASPNGGMFEALRKHYGVLSDYAHGGGRQVSRWLSAEGVGPRYSDEQMAEAVRFVDIVGVLAAHAREKVSGYPGDPFVARLEAIIGRAPSWRSGAPRGRDGWGG